MAENMVNTAMLLDKPLPNDEIMRIINANLKPKEKPSMFSFFSSTTTVEKVAPPKTIDTKVVSFSHTSGEQTFTFSIPGIDPKNIVVKNKDRKIYVINADKTIGVVTTMDQIDPKELTATYKFGQLFIIITPNVDKFKEYDVKVSI